jgi:RimJ/RimL family protein N-acetyltransferase/aminoglycoside phosphotransferase
MPAEAPRDRSEVRTDRLLLRRPVDADAPFVLALHADPRAIAHNPADALRDLADARARLAAWSTQWEQGLGYWIVEETALGRPVGVCGVKAVDLHGRPAWNLLYRFVPEAWGRGLAREAARASIDAAAHVDAARPVVARIRPANSASSRVARAIGLVRRPDLDLDGEDGRDEVWSTAPGAALGDDRRDDHGDVDEVQVVVAHSERATLRVGSTFLKIDGDQARLDREARVLALAPIPTPRVLWHRPHVLALAALPGQALGRLGAPSPASAAAWSAAGAVVRRLHDSPPPPWAGRGPDRYRGELEEECGWLVAHDVVPAEVVDRNRHLAGAVFRPYSPVFTHGDLQLDHVFADGDEITGVLDWSEGGEGDPLFDLAILTLGHEERLDEVLTGYGRRVDLEVVRAWWSVRSLTAIRWLVEHGFDPATPGGEIDVLLARM